jgi:hypothetical protein
MWKTALLLSLLISQIICFGHGFRHRHILNTASVHRLRTIITTPSPQPLVTSRRSTKTSLSSISSLSLDSSILPGHRLVGGGSGAQRLALFVLLTLVALRSVFPSVVSSLRSFAFSDGEEQIIGSTSSGVPPSATKLVTSVQKVFSSVISYAGNLVMEARSKLSAVYGDIEARVLSLLVSTDVVQLDDWKVCSLKSRELLSGGRYCRYRFELENGGAKIPLYIGQEVSN